MEPRWNEKFVKKEAQLSRRGGIYRCGKTTGIASRKGRNDRGTYRRCESTAVTQRCILDGGEAVGRGGGGVVCVWGVYANTTCSVIIRKHAWQV